MADTGSIGKRGFVLAAVILLWVIGLMWVLNRKGIVTTSRSDPEIHYGAEDAGSLGRRGGGDGSAEIEVGAETEGEEPAEIVLRGGPSEAELAEQARLAELAAAAAASDETGETGETGEDEGPPTYPVWFESERNLGVCKINWDGGSKTANLHVATRLPEGKLSFSYRCGKYGGRGSINVKPRRVNGVLFCKEGQDVTVKTVRSKDGRCGR